MRYRVPGFVVMVCESWPRVVSFPQVLEAPPFWRSTIRPPSGIGEKSVVLCQFTRPVTVQSVIFWSVVVTLTHALLTTGLKLPSSKDGFLTRFWPDDAVLQTIGFLPVQAPK